MPPSTSSRCISGTAAAAGGAATHTSTTTNKSSHEQVSVEKECARTFAPKEKEAIHQMNDRTSKRKCQTNDERAEGFADPSIYSTTPRVIFPTKVFTLLEGAEELGIEQLVSWMLPKGGNAFIIRDIKRFEAEILPKYFKMKSIRSFYRQLNYWNFERIRFKPKVCYGSPPRRRKLNSVMYSHSCFESGKPEKLLFVKRVQTKKTSARVNGIVFKRETPVQDAELSHLLELATRGKVVPARASDDKNNEHEKDRHPKPSIPSVSPNPFPGIETGTSVQQDNNLQECSTEPFFRPIVPEAMTADYSGLFYQPQSVPIQNEATGPSATVVPFAGRYFHEVGDDEGLAFGLAGDEAKSLGRVAAGVGTSGGGSTSAISFLGCAWEPAATIGNGPSSFWTSTSSGSVISPLPSETSHFFVDTSSMMKELSENPFQEDGERMRMSDGEINTEDQLQELPERVEAV